MEMRQNKSKRSKTESNWTALDYSEQMVGRHIKRYVLFSNYLP